MPKQTANQVLKKYFGYESFRPNQKEIVDAVRTGRDVLAVMPTGAGKSVCYQVPALLADGLTIVVSPLISLMKDQVNALEQAGIHAAYVNSALTPAQQGKVLTRAAHGEFTLLYVAPERLMAPHFLEACAQCPPAIVAIDEAHCISQWGQDFRPSYTHINDFLQQLPVRPVVCAFTATATKTVRNDILAALQLHDPLVVVASFDRPNLHFAVKRPRSKDAAVLEICRAHAGGSGIVYCTSRNSVEEVCAFLQGQGFSATRYHAGLSADERRCNQEDFVYDRASIMVATSAFGMGIDKSNVSFVVHYNMPLDVESYYQEAGRAGRDGEPADCVLLYAPKDVHTCEFLITRSNGGGEDMDAHTRAELQERGRQRLKMMTFYCTTQECLRQFLLKYFDEDAPGFCGNCSNCETNFQEEDVTVDAQKIISCVYRLGERNRQMGKTAIVDILRGSRGERIINGGLDTLSTYGLMADESTKRVRFILDKLIEDGLLEVTASDYPVVVATSAAARFLHDRTAFTIKVPKEDPVLDTYSKRAKRTVEEAPPNPSLFEALKVLRAELAAEAGMPAYVVFSNHTLHDMCRLMPKDRGELLTVSGVGQVKADRYGDEFLELIDKFREK